MTLLEDAWSLELFPTAAAVAHQLGASLECEAIQSFRREESTEAETWRLQAFRPARQFFPCRGGKASLH